MDWNRQLIKPGEIPDGYTFANFASHFLQALGFRIDWLSGPGPDGGRDLVAVEIAAYSEFRWLVSCKHWRTPVGVTDDAARLEKLDEFNCHGFMFFYSNEATSGLMQSIERVCEPRKKYVKYFNWHQIQAELLTNANTAGVLHQYFPRQAPFAKLDKLPQDDCCGDWEDPQYLMTYGVRGQPVSYRQACLNCVGNWEEGLLSSGCNVHVMRLPVPPGYHP